MGEIQTILGKENLDKVFTAIEDSKIKEAQLRTMSLKMKAKGIFDKKIKIEESNVEVFKFMLETWYEKFLIKNGETVEGEIVDGHQALVDILKHAGAKAVACKLIRPVQPEMINIGLPSSYYTIPNLGEQNKTGAQAYPSNQGQTLTCASHAVGKAVVEIFDSVGWDGSQEEIIETLIKEV